MLFIKKYGSKRNTKYQITDGIGFVWSALPNKQIAQIICDAMNKDKFNPRFGDLLKYEKMEEKLIGWTILL